MIEVILPIVFLAFLLQFFDSSLGMGYGTSITSVLILYGYGPLQAIPAVLFTNAIAGIAAGIAHHRFKNVDFRSSDRHVVAVLSGVGVVGILIATLIAINVPETWLKAYIGILVIVIGITILIKHKHKHKFSWHKIVGIATLASFNKGLTGGGYGSVVVGGQILSGVDGKKSIGIASMAEGIICIAGFTAYYFINGVYMNWSLIISLLIGALVSVPLAAWIVRKFHPKHLKFIIGLVSVVLGSAILTKQFL